MPGQGRRLIGRKMHGATSINGGRSGPDVDAANYGKAASKNEARAQEERLREALAQAADRAAEAADAISSYEAATERGEGA